MSLLYYEGVSDSGQKVRGRYGGSRSDLLDDLHASGILVTRIWEKQEKLLDGRFGFNDLRTTMEQLHYLLVAGLKIDQALGVMVNNARKKSVREFWGEVLTVLRDGVPLSQSLKRVAEQHDCQMEAFFVHVLAVGEEVGDLPGALNSLREYLDFKSNLIREVRTTLSYPAFLLAVAMVTIILVLGLILPRFASIYSAEELRQLPFVSQFALSVGRCIHAHPLMVLALFAMIAGGVAFAVRSKRLSRRLVDRARQLPLIRQLVLALDFARLFTALGTMLESGVAINKAIRLCGRMVHNADLSDVLKKTGEELKKGRKLSETWRSHALIPNDIVALTAVGETGACLDEIFQRTGKKYMELFKNQVGMLLTFLEPAIIVFLGIFIGFVVIAIMLAVVSVSDLYV